MGTNEVMFEVIKTCVVCDQEKKMPAIQVTCDDCVKKILNGDPKNEDEKRWKSQRIPSRYWGYNLDVEYDEYKDDSFVICGDIGTGKTHLACQLLMRDGGQFWTAIEMMDHIQDKNYWVDNFKSLKRICIDDLMKISGTNYRLEKMFEVIDGRYREKRKTIITVDASPDEMVEKFGRTGEAMLSRINSWMTRIELKKKWR